MGFFEQSPELRHNGEKYQSPHGWGKAIRTHELEAAIFCCLGQKDFAMAKIMLFLTGNAKGFRVSERTILERCNISESGYKKARKKLVEKEWIFHEAGKYIQVNFNKIFSDYKALNVGDSQESTQETEGKVDTTAREIISNPSKVSSVQTTGNTEDTKRGFPEETYNNINDNINDNKIKKINGNSITGRCEDTRASAADAAASQASSQPLRGQYYSTKEKKEAENDYYSWFGTIERSISRKYNNAQTNEDAARMYASDEYKAFMAEAEKRQNSLEKKYGKMFPH